MIGHVGLLDAEIVGDGDGLIEFEEDGVLLPKTGKRIPADVVVIRSKKQTPTSTKLWKSWADRSICGTLVWRFWGLRFSRSSSASSFGEQEKDKEKGEEKEEVIEEEEEEDDEEKEEEAEEEK